MPPGQGEQEYQTPQAITDAGYYSFSPGFISNNPWNISGKEYSPGNMGINYQQLNTDQFGRAQDLGASTVNAGGNNYLSMMDPNFKTIMPDVWKDGFMDKVAGSVPFAAFGALAPSMFPALFSGAGAAGAEAGAGAGSGVWGGAINSANAAGFGAGGAGAGIWGNAIQGANDAGFGGAGLFSGADNFDLMGDVGSLGGSGFNVSPSSLFSGGDPVMGGGGFNMSTANFMPGEVAGNPTLELLKRLGLGGSSPLSTGMNIFSGLYGMKMANDTQRFAKGIYERQNAFDPYRPQAAQDLMSFMSNPNLGSIPGYDAGVQLTKRELAKQGYRGSGNMAVALNKFSGDFYNQEWARRASLAGVNAPSAGGAAISGSLGGADLASRALASLGYAGRGLEQLLKGVA